MRFKLTTLIFLIFVLQIFQLFYVSKNYCIYMVLISIITYFIFIILDNKINTLWSIFILTLFFSFSVSPSIYLYYYPNMNIEVEEDFKNSVYLASISMIPILTGSFLYYKYQSKKIISYYYLVPRSVTISVFSLFLIALFAEITNGGYYQKGMIGNVNVNYTFLNKFSFVLFFKNISFVGIVLQILRYKITKNKFDLYLLILMNFIIFLIYIPSGSREAMLIFPFCSLIFYYKFENKSIKINLAKLSLLIVSLFFFVTIIGSWRVISLHVIQNQSVSERFMTLINIKNHVLENPEILESNNPAERFNDFLLLGQLYRKINQTNDYRNLEGLSSYIYSYVPAFLRSNEIDFNDGAIAMHKYGLDYGVGGSVPILLQGDLYSRFGLIGFLLLFLICLIYFIYDIILQKTGIVGIVWVSLFFFQILRLNTQTVLKHLIVFSRDFIFLFFLSIFLVKLIKKFSNIRKIPVC
jgi:hypothetical protein